MIVSVTLVRLLIFYDIYFESFAHGYIYFILYNKDVNVFSICHKRYRDIHNARASYKSLLPSNELHDGKI